MALTSFYSTITRLEHSQNRAPVDTSYNSRAHISVGLRSTEVRTDRNHASSGRPDGDQAAPSRFGALPTRAHKSCRRFQDNLRPAIRWPITLPDTPPPFR